MLLRDDEDGRSAADSSIHIKLHKSNRLLDDNFIYIKRDENTTILLDKFGKLAEKYSDCFYRNENSAIDLCDGYVVSERS